MGDGMCVGALPTIWFSRIERDDLHLLNLKCQVASGRTMDFITAAEQRLPVSPDARPLRLVIGPRFKGVPGDQADSFVVNGGGVVVSGRLKAVLDGFDLGETQLHEVPILQADGVTRTAYPPHFVLNVAQTRRCFVPEASEGVHQIVRHDETAPRPGAPWLPDPSKDLPAVSAAAAQGVDLWADPRLASRLFVSDRLKSAMDEARITRKSLCLVKAKSLP